VNGRRSDSEEALHIGLGGWTSHDEGIGVDEGQILALLVGEGRLLDPGVHVT